MDQYKKELDSVIEYDRTLRLMRLGGAWVAKPKTPPSAEAVLFDQDLRLWTLKEMFPLLGTPVTIKIRDDAVYEIQSGTKSLCLRYGDVIVKVGDDWPIAMPFDEFVEKYSINVSKSHGDDS